MRMRRMKMASDIKINKYFIIGPGFQGNVDSNLEYEDYVKEVQNKLEQQETLLFQIYEDDAKTMVIFRPLDSPVNLVIMNKKALDNYRREQMFAAQQQEQNRLSKYGRNV